MNENNEINKISTDVKVLEERIKKNEEILSLWLKTYRNYGFIIVAIITILGVGSIYYIIEQVVKKTTESKLEETLTDEYIAEKIKERSETAIDELISEVETRAETIMEENLAHQELATKALLACGDRDYERGIKLFEKAIAKIHAISSVYGEPLYDIERLNYLISIAELQILKCDYKKSLNTLRIVFPLIKKNEDKAFYYFLDSIAKKLLNLDTSESEKKLDEILKGKISSDWSFKLMKEWLMKEKISAENKIFILNKIQLIKQHMN